MTKGLRFDEDSLTWRERTFVQHFVALDFENATQAAILAGYAPRSARQQASDLLTRHDVSRALTREKEARERRLTLSKDRTLLEVMRIAYGDRTNLFQADEISGEYRLKPFEEMTEDERALISGIEQTTDTISQGKDEPPIVRTRLKVTTFEKNVALTMLMRHQNLLPTTAKSMVVNNDNRSINVTMQQLLAGLSADELREMLTALRERKPRP